MKPATLVATTLLARVAPVHGLRVALRMEVTGGGVAVPLWASAFASALTGWAGDPAVAGRASVKHQRWSRQTVRRVGTLIVVGWLGLFLGSALAATPRTLIATVDRVTDGDSVIANSDNNTKLRIRLLGIDAPEVPHDTKAGQPYGEEARDYLDHLIGGKAVRVDAYGPDQYKRVLAVLWDGQVNVNLLMVAMGYAEVYRGAPCVVRCQELQAAEAKARQHRVGMWAQGANYESPREFRRRIRLSGN